VAGLVIVDQFIFLKNSNFSHKLKKTKKKRKLMMIQQGCQCEASHE
jgi:hypothetical protein